MSTRGPAMVLALDQGTTSSRAIAFGVDGTQLALAQHEFTQHFPQPGWVEHDPLELLATQLRAMEGAWQAAGCGDVVAMGITNQRETVVVWDRATGAPVHRAIVWQDRRTAAALAELKARSGVEQRAREVCGLPLDPYFSASKIAWILDHVAGARAAAEAGRLCAGTVDTWLLWHLTGGASFATEPSNASRTGLMDLRTGTWSEELCGLHRVPERLLPAILPSDARFGTVTGRGWVVHGMLGDQQAALFGQSCLEPGSAKCTYGTGAFVLANAGSAVPVPRDGLLATVAWRTGTATTYALEGSVLVCGAAVQWLRDGLGILRSSADLEPMARSVPDSGGIVFVPAFAGLGTPHWDPDARGLLVGITRGTRREHVARATVEAMALQVDDVLAAMAGSRGAPLAELRVDGGAAANLLLLELQAALLGADVVRPAQLECTAFGAFRMALHGASGLPAARLPVLPGGMVRIRPDAAVPVATLRARWREAVRRAGHWAG